MSDQIDVNQLSNALQQKVDLPSGKNQADVDYVVEWKAPTSSDPTWYRLYKSGWVEQGGNVTTMSATITFPIAFANTYYCVFGNDTYNHGRGTDSDSGVVFFNKTTTTVYGTVAYPFGSTASFDWEAKGFAAQS